MQHITPPIKVRNSNLELLRIVSMFLVLLIHYIPSRMVLSTESVRSDLCNSLIQMELNSICFVCVNCFILISGYFNITWKLKSFSSLLYTILFWGVIAYLLGYFLVGNSNIPVTFERYNLLSATFTARWFIGAYLCLYMISPILNSFIEKCDSRQLGRFLIYFYIFSTIFGWLMLSSFFNEGMSVMSLIGLYILGAYLRKTKFKAFNLKTWTNLWIYLLLGICLVAINTITYYVGINKSIYGYLNPIIILESIYLFLFFKNLNIGYKPWINLIASSAFSVYLFHHNPFIFPFYTFISKWINVNVNFSLLSMIGLIAILFVVCTIIDQIGKKIFSFVWNKYNK